MAFIIPPEYDRIEVLDPHDTQICPCGKMFIPYRSYQRFCCDAHRSKYTDKPKSYYKKSPIVLKTCKKCGKEFKDNDRKRCYCSNTCYKKAQSDRRAEVVERKCLVCGTVFSTSHWSKRYCSPACRKSARKGGA